MDAISIEQFTIDLLTNPLGQRAVSLLMIDDMGHLIGQMDERELNDRLAEILTGQESQ